MFPSHDPRLPFIVEANYFDDAVDYLDYRVSLDGRLGTCNASNNGTTLTSQGAYFDGLSNIVYDCKPVNYSSVAIWYNVTSGYPALMGHTTLDTNENKGDWYVRSNMTLGRFNTTNIQKQATIAGNTSYDRWQLVIISKENGHINISLNETDHSQTAVDSSIDFGHASSTLIVGTSYSNGIFVQNFTGTIRGILIYDRPFTHREKLDLFSQGSDHTIPLINLNDVNTVIHSNSNITNGTLNMSCNVNSSYHGDYENITFRIRNLNDDTYSGWYGNETPHTWNAGDFYDQQTAMCTINTNTSSIGREITIISNDSIDHLFYYNTI